MNNFSVIVSLIAGTVLLFLFAVTLILVILTQKRKQNKHHLEKEQWQKKLIEERERTMNEISSGIHNHVLQIVSFSQMLLKTAVEEKKRERMVLHIDKAVDLLSDISDTLQVMGKTLSCEYIYKYGLTEVLELELEYINATCNISCSFFIEGTSMKMGPERELLLYRIIQEAIKNTLKHAQATRLSVLFVYEQDKLNVLIKDDGIGLPGGVIPETSGMGIINMRQRAEALNASLTITSDKGVTISLSCKLHSAAPAV